MTTIKGLPVYEAVLEEQGDGMIRISLVDSPAVEADFLAFERSARPQMYNVQSDDRRIVRGVVMRANYPIFRRDADGFEYWITFSPAVIRQMAEKYIAENKCNAIDLDHDEVEIGGVQMVQLFIKDTEAGINPAGFEDIEDGSLFGEFHIINDEVWQAVKDGTYRGFSIELWSGFAPVTAPVSTEKIQDILEQFFNSQSMRKSKELRVAMARALNKFGSISTDKGVINWGGDEPLAVGMEVWGIGEDGEAFDLEDGNYETETHTIVIADGKVEEIADKENTTENAAPSEESNFRKMCAKLESTFDEIYKAIYNALYVLGIDGWIAECSTETVVVEVYDYNGDKFVRYPYTIGADGVATLGEGEEVKPAFIPVGEEPAAAPAATPVEETEEYKSLLAKYEELKGKQTPAPAHDEYKKDEPCDEGLRSLARYCKRHK